MTQQRLEEQVEKLQDEPTTQEVHLQKLKRTHKEWLQQQSEEVSKELTRIRGRVEQVLNKKKAVVQELEQNCMNCERRMRTSDNAWRGFATLCTRST
jgi:ElaB/YqjD/DUF883 family membrane-anchored ribosome-binding protein